jgi:hypothetical protein
MMGVTPTIYPTGGNRHGLHFATGTMCHRFKMGNYLLLLSVLQMVGGFMFNLLSREIKNQQVTIGVFRMSSSYSVNKIPSLITIMNYIHIFPFRNINCNIILPSTRRFPKETHQFRFSNYNSLSFSYFICYIPSHKILLLISELILHPGPIG